MGGCATKLKVLKDGDDRKVKAPLPQKEKTTEAVPDEQKEPLMVQDQAQGGEEALKQPLLVQEITDDDDDKAAPDDQSNKRRSLSLLFKEVRTCFSSSILQSLPKISFFSLFIPWICCTLFAVRWKQFSAAGGIQCFYLAPS